jgi:hypothetical protein
MNHSRPRIPDLLAAAGHPGPPAVPGPPGPSPGALVLDIGGQTGALAIYAGVDRDGTEIEVSPAGADRARAHNVVRPRQAGKSACHAAVFPALPAGDYTVWNDADTRAGTVTIKGGHVTEFRLPAAENL